MVYDWFNRTGGAPEPTPSQDGPQGDPPCPSGEPIDGDAVDGDAVDGDAAALEWAKQAYARLKAQQEAAKQEAAKQDTAKQDTPKQEEAKVESVAAPVAPQGLSLLEQAAAQRAERQQAIAAPEPAQAPPDDRPPNPMATEPELGAFDDTFTWSAEVLAAQGKRIDQVSLEEIDWLSRLRQGLEKTRQGFVTQLLENLGDDPLTPEVLDDLEGTLLRADVGVKATDQVLEALRKRLNEEVVDPSEGIRFLKEQLRGILDQPIQTSAQAANSTCRKRLRCHGTRTVSFAVVMVSRSFL